VLYRLPELIEAVAAGKTVYSVEGEKDVESLVMKFDVVATCNPGGAEKWKSEYAEYFHGADVVLIPDNDERGWKHINAIGASLTGIAARIRVVILPGAKDVSEWIDSGGTREQLDGLIKVAPDWIKPTINAGTADKNAAEAEEDRLIAALAEMPPGIERARHRKQIAKQLGVRQSDVDDEITARQAGNNTAPLHGHWNVEPWPEAADGDALLQLSGASDDTS
jgi:DNA primase